MSSFASGVISTFIASVTVFVLIGCVQPLFMMASAVVVVPPFIFDQTLSFTTGFSSSLPLFALSALKSPSPHSFFCSSCKLLSSLYIGFMIPTLVSRLSFENLLLTLLLQTLLHLRLLLVLYYLLLILLGFSSFLFFKLRWQLYMSCCV